MVFDDGHGATLNIVRGGDMSRIAGHLHASGSVYLINRAGVMIGTSGRVDTNGSFLASGRGADASTFGDDGKHLRLRGGAKGAVVNRGDVVAGGNVSLTGRRVANSGNVSAPNADLIARKGVRLSGSIDVRRGIETSGSAVHLDGRVTGQHWLVDPKNLTVTASAAKTIDKSLAAGTNVVLETTQTGTAGPGTASKGPGDIVIAAALNWKTRARLTLDAYNSVVIDSPVSVKGKGALYVDPARGELSFDKSGAVTFNNLAATLKIDGDNYKLEKTIATLASGIAAHPSGHFALANNVKSTATYSFSPIPTTFTGTFEGLGHTISNLNIDDVTNSNVALFSEVDTNGVVRNVTLANATVKGLADFALVGGLVANNNGDIFDVHVSGKVVSGLGSPNWNLGYPQGATGAVAGTNAGTIANSTASASVTAGGQLPTVGGIAGSDYGPISDSHATGNVAGGSEAAAGGLVGWMGDTSISNSYATGTVRSGGGEAGGLVGHVYANSIASIQNSYATGDVYNVYGYAGGLAGDFNGTITGSHASGSVNGTHDCSCGGLTGRIDGTITSSHASGSVGAGADSTVGGLVGLAFQGTDIKSSFATGDVSASGSSSNSVDSFVGGLAGHIQGQGSIKNSYATGDLYVGGYSDAGGLFGLLDSTSTVTSSHATGNVNAAGGGTASTGGFGGNNAGTVAKSYTTGNVNSADGYLGGFLGQNSGTVNQSFAAGDVTGNQADIGGFVGLNGSGTIANSYALGSASGMNSSNVGGFAGNSGGTISHSYAAGLVTGDAGSFVGGFIGADNLGVYAQNYWDKTTSATNAGFGDGTGNSADVAGKKDSQLKAALMPGFNSAVWALSSSKNGGLPYLKANPPN